MSDLLVFCTDLGYVAYPVLLIPHIFFYSILLLLSCSLFGFPWLILFVTAHGRLIFYSSEKDRTNQRVNFGKTFGKVLYYVFHEHICE